MGFNPKHNKNKLRIKCPLKFGYPEIEQLCETLNCAWFLPIQRACAVQVLARGLAFPKEEMF